MSNIVKTYLVGYGGHSYVVADAFHQSNQKIHGYLDHKKADINPLELKYIGSESNDDLCVWNNEHSQFILCIGDNIIRSRAAEKICKKKKRIISVVHPSAHIAQKVSIDDGCFVAAGAHLNPLAQVGKYSILNTGCIVEHECIIKNCTHIAPGAVLAGNVSIGAYSFIGANSIVKQGVKIGANVIVGAGAVVLNDIPDNSKVVGNPERFI